MTAAVRFVIGAVLAGLISALFPVEVHAQPGATRVVLLAADESGRPEDVQAHLVAAGFDVDIFDAGAATPTLNDLASYDVVFTWANAPGGYMYADPAALGDVLASYVNSGRGVVQAGSSLLSLIGPSGQWTAGQYGAFSYGGFNMGSSLLQATLANHPILEDVASFVSGSANAFMNVMPQGCAELIARWSNGKPLVAAGAGPNGGRVVGLNFYPVSSNFEPVYWQTSSDGARLLANAVTYAASAVPHSGGLAVALVAADEPDRTSDVRCKLHNLETFSEIGVINAQTSTPDLAMLLGYNAVLTWTGSSYGDAEAMGDVLADYVDANRGVVHSPVSFSSDSRLGGRWISGQYRPIVETDPASEPNLQLQPFLAGHPMLSGVAGVDGGTGGHHAISGLNPVAGEVPTVVATWTNGQPMVVFKNKASGGGQIASLNMFPPSSDAFADSWNRQTDGARLMANMLMFVATPPNHAPTADAGADQTLEATSSAGVSVTLTATASDADGDALTMTWSGTGLTATGNSITFTAPPPATSVSSHTYPVTLTVTDGKGGEAIDVVNIVVQDTQGPVLQGVPGDVTIDATGPDGATFTHGPVPAIDAVDGPTSATCSPSGLFPVGNTVVSCTASDSRGNTSTSSFTVTVTEWDDGGGEGEDPVTPGRVLGSGYYRQNDKHYEFAFSAVERASGLNRGGLRLTVKPSRYSRRHNNHFVSKTIDAVTFAAGPSVLFSGTGRWNGRDGYLYEVSAAEQVVRRRRHDVVRITIKSSTGEIVAQMYGRLGAGGNVQFLRVGR